MHDELIDVVLTGRLCSPPCHQPLDRNSDRLVDQEVRPDRPTLPHHRDLSRRPHRRTPATQRPPRSHHQDRNDRATPIWPNWARASSRTAARSAAQPWPPSSLQACPMGPRPAESCSTRSQRPNFPTGPADVSGQKLRSKPQPRPGLGLPTWEQETVHA